MNLEIETTVMKFNLLTEFPIKWTLRGSWKGNEPIYRSLSISLSLFFLRPTLILSLFIFFQLIYDEWSFDVGITLT